MCQYAKGSGTYFRNFDFTIFGEFLQFYIWTQQLQQWSYRYRQASLVKCVKMSCYGIVGELMYLIIKQSESQ